MIAPRVRMMEGKVAEFDIPTVMQVACLGRQFIELHVLDGKRVVLGTIFIKGGKVVSARAGGLEGVAAIHHLLDSPESTHFVLYRVMTSLSDSEPLGSVSEILIAAAAPQRISVMEGSFDDFDLKSLLPAVGLMRQHTELEVWEGNVLLGTVALRSGMVLGLTAGDLNGVAALKRLMAAGNKCRFAVFRSPSVTDENIDPIGALNDVMDRALALPVKASIPPPRPTVRWLDVAPLAIAAAALGLTALVYMHVSTKPSPEAPAVTAPAPVVPPASSWQPAAPVAEAPAAAASPVAHKPGYDPQIEATQLALKKLGFDPGPIDGLTGPLTTAGVEAFQEARHLKVDGIVGSETLGALKP